MSSKPSARRRCSRSRAWSREHLRSHGSSGPSGLRGLPSKCATTLVTTARRPPRSRNRAIPSRSNRQLLRAPDPTQPSKSRAARSIHREPAHEPISTGGPPRAAGQTGSSDARPTRSPVQSRRMIDSDSSSRRKREAKSRPSASKSAAVDPAPTPSRSRPPDTRRVVSTRWASSTGFRNGTCSTPVPSSTWRVTVAATERAVSGSASRNPRPMASNAQTLSKPAASIRRAASARLWASSAGPLRPPEGRMIPKRVTVLSKAPRARYAKAEGKTSLVAIVWLSPGESTRIGEGHAFRSVHEYGRPNLVGRAGPLATPRGDEVGHRLRHRPLHAEHEGARGHHARIVEHARRAGGPGATPPRRHHRAGEHVSPSGGGREDGRAGRHHLRRPPPPRARRGLAAERARGLRNSLLHTARAAGAAGRGLSGDPVAVDRTPRHFQRALLPALRRPARSQARPDAAPRTDDRRRGRARHPAYRRQARRPLERLGRPERRDAEREDPRRALRRSRSRPEDHQALGQHGVAHHRQEG